jgi:hypothetical protein
MQKEMLKMNTANTIARLPRIFEFKSKKSPTAF